MAQLSDKSLSIIAFELYEPRLAGVSEETYLHALQAFKTGYEAGKQDVINKHTLEGKENAL